MNLHLTPEALFSLYWRELYFLMAVAAVLALIVAKYSGGAGKSRPVFAGVVGRVIGGVLTALALAHVLQYFFAPGFRDYAEPMVVVVSMNWLNGSSMYQDWSHNEGFVGSLYGPYLFLLQSLALWLSPSIYASKAIGVIAAFTSLGLIFVASWRITKRPSLAVSLVFLSVAYLVPFTTQWFWNRPDPLLILLTAAAAFSAIALRPSVAAVAIGSLAGIAANLKLHAPVYILPLGLYLLLGANSLRQRIYIVLAGLCSAVVFLIGPFMSQLIRVGPYTSNLSMASHHGLESRLALESLCYGASLAAPIMAMLVFNGPVNRVAVRTRIYLLSLALCMIVMAVLSAKPGSGTPHMMPFVPLAALAYALLIKQDEFAGKRLHSETLLHLACVFVWLTTAPLLLWSSYDIFRWSPDRSVEAAKNAELIELSRRFPPLEMTTVDGPQRRDVYNRTAINLSGQVTHFDPVNWGDLRFGGLDPQAVLPLFANCRVESWVAPSHNSPFTGSIFTDLFDERVRAEFRAKYMLVFEGKFYSVWKCRNVSDPGSPASNVP